MIEYILMIIEDLRLPNRKTISKEEYVVYLLIHDNDMHYFGVTKNFNVRLKQHRKSKTIIESHILFKCNSLANAKIVECYLTLHFKLNTDIKISNKRTESLIL